MFEKLANLSGFMRLNILIILLTNHQALNVLLQIYDIHLLYLK